MIIENVKIDQMDDGLSYIFPYIKVLKAVLFFRVIKYNEFAHKLTMIA